MGILRTSRRGRGGSGRFVGIARRFGVGMLIGALVRRVVVGVRVVGVGRLCVESGLSKISRSSRGLESMILGWMSGVVIVVV